MKGATPTVEDFDKKLAETDRYLQLLLNQVAALKEKVDDPEASPEARAKYEDIAEKTHAMTESIKHAIVLLQIAKNATLPEQGSSVPIKASLVQAPNSSHAILGSPVSRPSSQPKKDGFAALVGAQDHIETGIELGAECKEKVHHSDNQGRQGHHHVHQQEMQQQQQSAMRQVSPKPNSSSASLKPLKTSGVPEISYSSSEDEDFFDAEDDEEMTSMATAVSSIAEGSIKPATLDLAATSNDSFATLDNMIQSPLTPEEGKEYTWPSMAFNGLRHC